MKYFLPALIVSTILTGQQYTDAFLRIGAYPRSIGVGQAVCALTSNNGGFLINPAANGFVNGTNLSAMYINQFGLADYIAISTNHPWRQIWQVGINLVNLSVDNIPERPDLRSILDLETRRDSIRTLVARGFSIFKDRETGVFLTLTRNLSTTIDLGWQITPFDVQIPIGLNIKLLHKELYNLVGNGIGVDLGTMLSFNLADATGYDWIGELTLGLSVSDVAGTLIYWNSGKYDKIHPAVISGVGYRHSFQVIPVDIIFLTQKKSTESEFDFGMECILKNLVAVRFGTNLGAMQGGLGLMLPFGTRPVSIDYSFTAHDLGNAHRIGGSITL